MIWWGLRLLLRLLATFNGGWPINICISLVIFKKELVFLDSIGIKIIRMLFYSLALVIKNVCNFFFTSS